MGVGCGSSPAPAARPRRVCHGGMSDETEQTPLRYAGATTTHEGTGEPRHPIGQADLADLGDATDAAEAALAEGESIDR